MQKPIETTLSPYAWALRPPATRFWNSNGQAGSVSPGFRPGQGGFSRAGSRGFSQLPALFFSAELALFATRASSVAVRRGGKKPPRSGGYGTIWQRWSVGLFSFIVVHAGRSHNCAFAERKRIRGTRKRWGAKSRGRPCGGKFMRRRRPWKRGHERGDYFSLAYSALACLRMGMSASFQGVRKS
jgi:hypothetical protein